MAEIIETLMTTGEERQTFTVDKTKDFVGLDPDFTGAYTLYGALDSVPKVRKFVPNDSIRILSMGITLPYNFGLAYDNVYLYLIATDGLSATYLNVGSINGYISIPFANYELAMNVFIPYPNLFLGKPIFYQVLLLGESTTTIPEKQMKISMIGIPSCLNGKKYPVTTFIKILHTIPMIKE